MMSILERNPQVAMGYQMQQNGYKPPAPGMSSYSQPPGADLSGNPYASNDRY